MEFKNNDDLRRFAETLSQDLELLGETVLANDLKNWSEEYFTTASEFLGELKLILERIKYLKSLDEITKKNVGDCITAINEVFGM